jgi:hypothetical protein
VSAADLQPLIERFGLSAAAGRQLNVLAHMLSEDPLAPTTVREPERVRDDHLADSLVALELNVVREARTMIDIGAGAGLPGLALAAALPTAQISQVLRAASSTSSPHGRWHPWTWLRSMRLRSSNPAGTSWLGGESVNPKSRLRPKRLPRFSDFACSNPSRSSLIPRPSIGTYT